ncbi:MAG: lysophospholipid acyltransferase family protein [Bacteroidales bacterium]
MKRILYYLVYSILWLITLLPLPVLYLFSDFVYLILYYLVGYRKQTVYQNLRNSLPYKSPKEIRHIARKFYRQLCDYFIESIYRIHMGEKENARRLHYINPELLQDYYNRGKSIVLLLSHYGNWEWPTRISKLSYHDILAIYKPLQNKYFDRLFLQLRGQFGAIGIPMDSTLRTLVTYQRNNQPVVLYTIADQRPQWTSIQHWTTFLNQDTPVITGPEKIARRSNIPVYFLNLQKIKRGFYSAEFMLICENPKDVPEFDITRKYLAMLERSILQRPEIWLWSHKRWKYFRHEAQNPVYIGDLSKY